MLLAFKGVNNGPERDPEPEKAVAVTVSDKVVFQSKAWLPVPVFAVVPVLPLSTCRCIYIHALVDVSGI